MNPEYYRDASADSAIEDTKAIIDHIATIDPSYTLISPIITPRFAPSCTESLLCSLGKLAAQTGLPIQTHIAENPDEIKLVAKLFPDCSSYADVYDHYGLLTSRSVLAHGVHLMPEERKLIKKRGASISHCPISNSAISSGLCPVRELLDDGITVGLGSDVSGGWSPSVLAAAREAGMVSRVLAAVERDWKKSKGITTLHAGIKDQKLGEAIAASEEVTKAPSHSSRTKLTVEECLYLATVGGASCLGLESKIGRFTVGMEWDAQLIALDHVALNNGEVEDEDGEMDYTEERTMEDRVEDKGLTELWGKEKWEEKVAKWVFCGDDRNTKKVFVKGRLVHRR